MIRRELKGFYRFEQFDGFDRCAFNRCRGSTGSILLLVAVARRTREHSNL